MAEGFEIRPARLEEGDRVIEMYEWLFAPPGVVPPGWDPAAALERWRRAAAAERGVTFVAALPDGALAGFITACIDLESVRFGSRCWVEDFAVDPVQRSQGIGAALLAAARAWGAEQGATHLELDSGEARRDAHRFYERERPDWRSNQYTWLLG